MDQKALTFIRKNGKVIPIRAAAGAAGKAAGKALGRASSTAHAVGALGGAYAIHKSTENKEKSTVKVNPALGAIGLGLSVASGALAAATFSKGAKGLAAGHAVAHAIDIAGVTTNVASVAGKGQAKERSVLALKNEARNFAIGNAVYAAGVLGVKKNREALAGYAKKIIEFGRKAVRVAE